MGKNNKLNGSVANVAIIDEAQTIPNKTFPITDINGDEIGSNTLDVNGEIIETNFSVEVKRLDGSVFLPTENTDSKKYIEFVDSDSAIRYSPEPSDTAELISEDTSELDELSNEEYSDKEVLEIIRDKISDSNPFKLYIQNLLNEVISKI